MWIVDAANVIGSRPDGWWRDRPGAADRFLRRIDHALAQGRIAPPVVVVLEGAARAGAEPFEDLAATGRAAVVHAGGSGDDEIVTLVGEVTGEHDGPIRVVTADRELSRRVRELGAEVVGPTFWYSEIEA